MVATLDAQSRFTKSPYPRRTDGSSHFVVGWTGAVGVGAVALADPLGDGAAGVGLVGPLIPGKGLPPVGMGNTAPCADGELGEIPGTLFEGVGIGIWLVAGFGTGPLVVAGLGVGIGPGACATFNSNGTGGDELAVDDAGLDVAALMRATGVAAEATAVVGEFG